MKSCSADYPQRPRDRSLHDEAFSPLTHVSDSRVLPGLQAIMPRYFFHVHDRRGWLRDFEGVEIDSSGVRKCAIEQARSVICDDVQHGVLDLGGRIEVTSDGKIVLVLDFKQVVARLID